MLHHDFKITRTLILKLKMLRGFGLERGKRMTRTLKINAAVVLLAAGFILGCGGVGQKVFRVEPELLLAPEKDGKLDYCVKLILDDSYCSLRYYVTVGLTYYADIGECLCLNSREMAYRLFRSVVMPGEAQRPARPDFILIPEVVKIDKTNARLSWEETTIMLYVKWRLLDNRGNPVWSEVIKGVGKGKMGGPFSYETNSIAQHRMAIKDMLINTEEAIRAAEEHLDRHSGR
jgi:hypothetical protein